MKNLYPLFKENVRQYNLINPDDTIILGFSGGKDSVTLFFLLRELQKEIAFKLVVAYFNHNLRTDAGDEQKWIENFCTSQGAELVTGSKDVMVFKDENKLNLEHAASLSRYEFFKEVSLRYPNPKVATAHTLSDLTETFFIKLFRGSGLQGLSTIYHKIYHTKANTIIRPLLLFDQEDILEFLERNGLEYYEDYTNKGDQFLRNKIRHGLVPEIKKIEPNIYDHIFRTVTIIQSEYDYFSELAKSILNEHLLLEKILKGKILEKFHPAVQRHIIREYIRILKGDLLHISFDHIEAIRTKYEASHGLAIPGLELTFHKGFIFPSNISIPPYDYELEGGFLEIPDDGPGIPYDVLIDELGVSVQAVKIDHYKKPLNNDSIVIPMELVKFPLLIRNAEMSDKYMKINTNINQKVIEMIRASGIPSELRNLCPVVANGSRYGVSNDIIWVYGSPVADAYKVRDMTAKRGKFLRIEIIGQKEKIF